MIRLAYSTSEVVSLWLNQLSLFWTAGECQFFIFDGCCSLYVIVFFQSVPRTIEECATAVQMRFEDFVGENTDVRTLARKGMMLKIIIDILGISFKLQCSLNTVKYGMIT